MKLRWNSLDEIVSNSSARIHGNGKGIIPIEPWNPRAVVVVPVLAGIRKLAIHSVSGQ